MKRTGRKKIPDDKAAPEKVLRGIMTRLRHHGASAVKRIEISDIVVDERVRLKCQIPVCDSYNRNLMCPPFVPPVAFFRDALSRYTGALLIQITAPLSGDGAGGPSADIFTPAKKLHELVNLAEKWALAHSFRFATGLIGGCCRLCDECAAEQNGRICRYPFKARPSMEAMGIDVVETAARARLPIHFPIVNKITWTGVLLI